MIFWTFFCWLHATQLSRCTASSFMRSLASLVYWIYLSRAALKIKSQIKVKKVKVEKKHIKSKNNITILASAKKKNECKKAKSKSWAFLCCVNMNLARKSKCLTYNANFLLVSHCCCCCKKTFSFLAFFTLSRSDVALFTHQTPAESHIRLTHTWKVVTCVCVCELKNMHLHVCVCVCV